MRTTTKVLVLGTLAAGLLGLAASSPAQPADPELERVLAAEEQRLIQTRADYPGYFAEAYARFPEIPHGVLEAMAWSASRWLHLAPDHDHAGHEHKMPPAYGVMGLYGGDGFADQLSEAARLLKADRAVIATDPRWNILGAAALLALEIDAQGAMIETAEDLAPVLARFAGFSPQAEKSAIDDYARDSFAFDVLLALDRGVNEKGAVVPEVPIAWEDAFVADTLVKLEAPFLRLDLENDRIEAGGYAIDPITGNLVETEPSGEKLEPGEDGGTPKSADYGPALWNPAHSSNYTAYRNSSVSAVTIHTAQGTYAGTISWFKNASANVSAHYVIRSSDGQVTQMVREAHRAWHVRSHNDYTVGIEHEGWVNNSSWYTTAMYNSSAALVRNVCAKYSGLSCTSAYNGPAHSGVVVLPTSTRIKGHQHFSGNTHTDPGINWNWSHYYNLLNPSSGGTTRYLDRFETSVGHFYTSPTYSGSTVGISSASTTQRNCNMARNGNCSLQVKLVNNPNTNANWQVRLLSGAGRPANNVPLSRNNGRIGFWVYSGGSGMSVAVSIDDSDGIERSIQRSIPAGQWTYVSWQLYNSAHWNAWVGGNGAISASTVTLDAIWFFRQPTNYDVYLYVDDVQIRN